MFGYLEHFGVGLCVPNDAFAAIVTSDQPSSVVGDDGTLDESTRFHRRSNLLSVFNSPPANLAPLIGPENMAIGCKGDCGYHVSSTCTFDHFQT